MNIDFKRKSTISTTIFSNYVIQSRMNGLIARCQHDCQLKIKSIQYINEQTKFLFRETLCNIMVMQN